MITIFWLTFWRHFLGLDRVTGQADVFFYSEYKKPVKPQPPNVRGA
jgi:hypothetical protein